MIPVALNTGNCELRTECQVKEILTDERGRARGVSYFDERGRLQEQLCGPGGRLGLRYRVGAAAAQLAEQALSGRNRQSLRSGGPQSARSLLLGRDWASLTDETYDDLGPGASIAVMDYNHGTPGLVGGGMLANEFIRLPIQMVDRMPQGTPRWGLGHKQAMRKLLQAEYRGDGAYAADSIGGCAGHARPGCARQYGIAVVRISGNVHPHTFEIGAMQAQRAEAWLKEAGRLLRSCTGGSAGGGPGWAAPGGNLPDGQRSEEFGGRPDLSSA